MGDICVIEDNFAIVRANIERAKPHPNHHTILLAVSKSQPEEKIIRAYKAGQRDFGENYVQECHAKSHDPDIQRECPDIRWHVIGHVQSNKINKLLDIPNLYSVQSVDSAKFAKLLNDHFAKKEDELGRKDSKLDVYVQVNTSGEAEKSGTTIGEAYDVVKFIIDHCDRLNFIGLMVIGVYPYDTSLGPNPDFVALINLRDTIAKKLDRPPESIKLNMGMSPDYEQAVQLGSNLVRVGMILFGERIRKPRNS